MTEPDHLDEDLLLEVALGHADTPSRDAAAAHLTVCPACRVAYDKLADAIELALPAVPRVPPPPHFETEVLGRLRQQPDAAARDPGERHTRRRTALLAVAAGLAGLATGAGLVLSVDDRNAGEGHQVVAAGAAQLLTRDGESVGTVSRSWSQGEPVLVVDVRGGQAGRSYDCRLLLDDGTRRNVGEWELAEDRVNSWVVPDPGARAVELVGESGAVWSTAEL